MKTEEAIKLLGSVKDIAESLNISVQAVYQWGEVVPRLRAYEIRDVVARKNAAAAVDVAKVV